MQQQAQYQQNQWTWCGCCCNSNQVILKSKRSFVTCQMGWNSLEALPDIQHSQFTFHRGRFQPLPIKARMDLKTRGRGKIYSNASNSYKVKHVLAGSTSMTHRQRNNTKPVAHPVTERRRNTNVRCGHKLTSSFWARLLLSGSRGKLRLLSSASERRSK